MTREGFTRLTGYLLVAVGVAATVPFALLVTTFNYPLVLRMAPNDVLKAFWQAGSGLIWMFYASMLAAVGFVAAVLLLHRVLAREGAPYLPAATALGAVAGVLQAVGLARWVFLVPLLADRFQDPSTGAAARGAVLVLFEGANRYLGTALGEHVGQLLAAAWLATVSAAMLGPTRFPRWLGRVGQLVALALFLGLADGLATVFGLWMGMFHLVTPLAWVALSVWLVLVGGTLLRAEEPA